MKYRITNETGTSRKPLALSPEVSARIEQERAEELAQNAKLLLRGELYKHLKAGKRSQQGIFRTYAEVALEISRIEASGTDPEQFYVATWEKACKDGSKSDSGSGWALLGLLFGPLGLLFALSAAGDGHKESFKTVHPLRPDEMEGYTLKRILSPILQLLAALLVIAAGVGIFLGLLSFVNPHIDRVFVWVMAGSAVFLFPLIRLFRTAQYFGVPPAVRTYANEYFDFKGLRKMTPATAHLAPK